MSPQRRYSLQRETRETRVLVKLDLDGQGRTQVDTGIGFLDHLWTTWAYHARIDLELRCQGDLQVDDHHSCEDCALGIGEAIDQALGERSGLNRFGHSYLALDESLVRAVVDLSGRPHAEIKLEFARPTIGALATENISHGLRSLAMASRSTLHIDQIRGHNAHHIAEAAYKATAVAFRQALAHDARPQGIPSTKGVL